MNVFFMHKDRDFDMRQTLPDNADDLIRDLELRILFAAMAQGDPLIREVSSKAVLTGSQDLETLHYRQAMMRDCLHNAGIIRTLYALAVEAMERRQKNYLGIFSHYPSSILYHAIGVMTMFADVLGQLRQLADQHSGQFQSEGFSAFFAMIRAELDDEYLASIRRQLQDLKFPDGVLIRARVGKGNESYGYTLCRPEEKKRGWMERIFTAGPPAHTFRISQRDESGMRALAELKDRGINRAANALAQAVDHIFSFFRALQTELAFYVGCLNVYDLLAAKGYATAIPGLAASTKRQLAFQGLYDVCLALMPEGKVTGNSVHADGKELIVITGANQGGKSTFLRSVALAQLMLQSGMFVAAEYYSANICRGIFTHFKREEDAALQSGKLDEELLRMSAIVDRVTLDSMVLFNESFAATNEREGSEIARQITLALVERHVKVLFVTHLYPFAHGLYDRGLSSALFLRADRQADGERSFTMTVGEPLQTSYGYDLYQKIFGGNGGEDRIDAASLRGGCQGGTSE